VSESSMERKFHGSESSLYGLFAPWNESAEERKGQLPCVWAVRLHSNVARYSKYIPGVYVATS